MSPSGPGPRDYVAATERALYAYSGTTCYYPDCKTPVIVFIEGEPVSNVEIAHIKGAYPGSSRYDAAMTDDGRRSFPNLILLCKPHHEVVDKRHPERYPVEVLAEWKTRREAEAGIDRLELSMLTEDRLVGLIEEAVGAARLQRLLTVELGLGVAFPGETATFPAATAKDYFDMYADQGPAVLILTIRSQGSLKGYVNSHSLRFGPMGMRLMGANDFLRLNPRLPSVVDVGESRAWLYDLKNVRTMVRILRAQGGTVDSLVGEADLGSGETIESSALPVEYLESID